MSDVEQRADHADYEEGKADGYAGKGVPLTKKSDDWIRGYTAGKREIKNEERSKLQQLSDLS